MMEKKYTDEKNYLSVRIKWCALLAAGLIGAFLVRMWVVCIREMQSLMVPAVFTALSAALAVIVYRTVLIPYRETRKIYEQFVMGYVMEDLFKVRYPFSPESEQAVLRLNEIIDRNNLIAISKKQAEYLALQNQITPHLLLPDCMQAGSQIEQQYKSSGSPCVRHKLSPPFYVLQIIRPGLCAAFPGAHPAASGAW